MMITRRDQDSVLVRYDYDILFSYTAAHNGTTYYYTCGEDKVMVVFGWVVLFGF